MISYPLLSQTGRLGNQLWEIASTYGIAYELGDGPAFPKWDYQPYFCVPQEWFDDPCAKGKFATEFVDYMDPRARAYLQDYSLFELVEKQVKTMFKPTPVAKEILDQIWEATGFADLAADGDIVSVHIRRGDNVTHPQGYHPLRSWDYYREALDHRSGVVAVFSDDPAWSEEHFEKETGCRPAIFYRGTARPREYVDREKYEDAPVLDWIDLQLMARCQHHVLSNSTYAWWGAFLSDDPSPIYPSNWFGWRIRDWTDASLMFPESWQQIEDPTLGGV